MTFASLNGGAGVLRRLLLALSLGAAALLLSARPGHAATIQVKNADQLQAAVRDAHDGDTIVLAAGVYAPDATLKPKVSLTLAGPSVSGPPGGAPGAVVSGGNIEGGIAPDIVDVDPGLTVTLRNLSFRLASSEGAAIFVGGTLRLEDSELSQNNSSAVVVVDDGGTLAA